VDPVKTEMLKSDGTRFPVEMSLHLSVDEQGNPQGFNAVIRDISDRIRQEELVRDTQEKQKYILDSLPDMILEVDSDMKILWANKTAIDLNPDAIGQSCHEAFPGNEAVCDGCFCAKALKTKKLESGIMYQPASKTAGESYWENLGIPLKNKNGKEMTVLEVSRNVTTRVKAEKEKEKLISQLESALKDVKQLSGLLPICAHCKKIRDDNGYWNQIESYLHEHSEAQFSHGICQDCAKKYYPDMDLYEDE
jgi:transcriptional regulator with PAS, ATPase and Fis domain